MASKKIIGGARRVLYEQLMFAEIERVSAQVEKETGTPLTLRQAQGLRQKMGDILRDDDRYTENMQNVKLEPVYRAIDTVLSDVVDNYESSFADVYSGSVKPGANARYNDVFQRFMRDVGTAGRIPLSPVDPSWANRDFVRRKGFEQLYVAISDLNDARLNADTMRGTTVSLPLYDESGDRATVYAGAGKPPRELRQYDRHDMTGMARLAPYINAKDYNKLYDHVVRGLNGDVSNAMSDEGLACAVAVLEDLTASGVNFTVRADRNPGALKASIPGGPDIRVVDTRENEKFIGRGYNDGVITRFSLVGQGARGDDSLYTPTPEQAVLLSRVARGVVTPRVGGGEIGEPNANNAAYFTQDACMMHTGMSVVTGQYGNGRPMTADLYIRDEFKGRNYRSNYYRDADAALAFLSDAVKTASDNYAAELDVDGIIDLWKEHGDNPDFVPEFEGPDDIAALKSDYWAVLTGTLPSMPPPGITKEEYRQAEGEPMEFEIRHGDDAAAMERAVRDHADRMIVTAIGTLEPQEENGELRRFNPVGVASYMDSPSGVWRNNDDIVAALRRAEIDPSQLRGDEFYNRTVADRMIQFNADTAQDMRNHDDPFIASMGEVIGETIGHTGASVDSIDIDDNGVVRWSATRHLRDGKHAGPKAPVKGNGNYVKVTGEIGQVLSPGEHGEVTTKFAASDNYVFVPGYEATVVPQQPGENLSVEERTVLRGYEQVVADALRSRVRSDILYGSRNEVGEPTSINSALRRLYDSRYPIDYVERMVQDGLSAEFREAIIDTESRRVRYDRSIIEDSTTLPLAMRNNNEFIDTRNDLSRDGASLTGYRNMSVLDYESGDGYFDPIMTGMALNQGVVRYLADSASVDADGRIVRGEPGDRARLMKMPQLQNMRYDPHDRQNMTISNILQASDINDNVPTAMTHLGGWTFEDGMVISKEFAETHGVLDTNGERRSLIVGDKISDMHGNKGVISLVVDADMTDEEAAEAGLTMERDFFKNNPGVDLVMSPFSSISRFNAGTARDMMSGETRDLVMPDGSVVPDGVGELSIITTHMTVDAKTNIYDADEMRRGKGRKASSQLMWTLQANGCHEVGKWLYSTNDSGIANAREVLVSLGYDMSPNGTLSVGYSTESEPRYEFEMLEPVLNANGNVNMKKSVDAFGEMIRHRGGVMQIPFELRMPSGEMTPESDSTQGMYLLPVLSSHMRQEQDLSDGSTVRHDYTSRYRDIYEQALRWNEQQMIIDNSSNPSEIDAAHDRQRECMAKAQSSYNIITSELAERHIKGKRNIFREGVMNNRMPNSASAVWTPDPRLDVDTVAMSSEMATELAVDHPDGKYVMVFRDPQLTAGGVRYMRVEINDDLTGVAVNPAVVKSFDGDFDGDSVGLIGNFSPAAHKEALEKLTVEANLLNRGLGSFTPEGVTQYPLAMHTDGLDLSVYDYAQRMRGEESYTGKFDEIAASLSKAEHDWASGVIDDAQLADIRAESTDKISDLLREGFANTDHMVALQFGDMDSHMKSVAQCYITGAKGSASKLDSYAMYMNAERDESGVWRDRAADGNTPANMQRERDIREMYKGSQEATSYKAQATGVAGAKSQQMVKALRGQGLVDIACNIGYPATQSMLQAKHDPVDAKYRADTLIKDVNDLFKGRKMERVVDDNGRFAWSVVKDDKGPVQATREEWVQQVRDMYVDSRGMGVAVGDNVIEGASYALCDDNGVMRDATASEMWTDPSVRPLPLDRLAYGGNKAMDELNALAESKANLFEGHANDFASHTVRKNIRSVDKMLAGELAADTELTPVMKKDTVQVCADVTRTVIPRLVRARPVAEVLNETPPDDNDYTKDSDDEFEMF